MKRSELKTKAKELVRGNKWYLWKPIVMVTLIVMIIGIIVSIVLSNISDPTGKIIAGIIDFVLSLFETAFMIAYAKYVIEFVRGKKMDWKETLTNVKEHFWLYLVVTYIVNMLIFGATILLVVPGIIASLGLVFYQEVCADSPELGDVDIIKKAWRMTKGYKLDIFVLGLSFIGWAILGCLTLGILYIWLMPYMVVTYTLLYEKLNKEFEKK